MFLIGTKCGNICRKLVSKRWWIRWRTGARWIGKQPIVWLPEWNSGLRIWELLTIRIGFNPWREELRRNTMLLSRPITKEECWKGSQESCWYNKNRMLPVFRAVVFAIHLKPGDIVPGILVLRPLLSIRPFVYRLSLLLIRGRPWISRPLFWGHSRQ